MTSYAMLKLGVVASVGFVALTAAAAPPQRGTSVGNVLNTHWRGFGRERRGVLGTFLGGGLAWGGGMRRTKAEDSASVAYSLVSGTTFRAPGAWERGANGYANGFTDRFTKTPVADAVDVIKRPCKLGSIQDLGKVERVQVSKALGFWDELGLADLVAAKISRDAQGRSYYQWDLALAPAVCAEGDQFGGALGCSYDRINLLSATVDDGSLYILRVQSNVEEWKGHGIALRELRDSFTVGVGGGGDPESGVGASV